MGEFLEFIRQ
jgi:hypothetical protein